VIPRLFAAIPNLFPAPFNYLTIWLLSVRLHPSDRSSWSDHACSGLDAAALPLMWVFVYLWRVIDVPWHLLRSEIHYWDVEDEIKSIKNKIGKLTDRIYSLAGSGECDAGEADEVPTETTT
jgi:hypothetical protein